MTPKKKILVSTNYHKTYTGFGKNCKNILSHLFRSGKYEIVEFANGVVQGHPDLELSPWKVIGSIPADQAFLDKIKGDGGLARIANYGHFAIDAAIESEKPDIFLGIEDIWAFNGYWNRPWWNKINCMVWTTLDSLPLLPESVKMAKECQNYFVWASFAEKAMASAGHPHVKTLHGSLVGDNFKKLSDSNRADLKKTFGLSDNFVIGFVFRNQLRKSVPNLLDGYKLFSQRNPTAKAKLLLHTNWKEGWDIVRSCAERSIDLSNILTTYSCSKCKNYAVHNFVGHDADCPYCKAKKSFNTVSIDCGVNEAQLNEIYNMMDVYCHPFTSGGQEIPIQEAKLCELVTLVTNYSCGEDMCSEESGGIPLKWNKYEEPVTQFIKASTDEASICESLEKVLRMSEEERAAAGKLSRQYILDNYSIDVIGPRLESIFDAMPPIPEAQKTFKKPEPSEFSPNYDLEAKEFVEDVFKSLFGTVPKNEEVSEWIKKIEGGETKEEVFKHLFQISSRQNIKLKEALDPKDKGRVGIAINGDSFIGLAASYFIKSIKEMYPDWSLYCFAAPQIIPIFEHLPEIKAVFPFNDSLLNSSLTEGSGDNEGYFDVFYTLPIDDLIAQKYSHNCKDVSCI
jgi:glycosyltransferase involved in cell wall biosynthesis